MIARAGRLRRQGPQLCCTATIVRVPPKTQPLPPTRFGGPADPGLVDGIGTGSVLDGRYELQALLGQGGTATVYRGTDTLLGRAVAVKVFHSYLTDPVTLTRQRQEMRVLAGLQHPHLVAVYDARVRIPTPADADSDPTDVGPSYLVMEFVNGPTLARRLTDTSLSSPDTARVGVAIASALDVVHSRGVVHRDVKPGNILLTASGEAKLGDFGIARALNAERVTSSAAVLGTAAYLSPEQARGTAVGPASDVYALGLVLLECLTGRREFPGGTVEAAVARLIRDPAVPETLPEPWPDLLRSMTSPRPQERPTARDTADRLVGVRDDRIGVPQQRLIGVDPFDGHDPGARRTPPDLPSP